MHAYTHHIWHGKIHIIIQIRTHGPAFFSRISQHCQFSPKLPMVEKQNGWRALSPFLISMSGSNQRPIKLPQNSNTVQFHIDTHNALQMTWIKPWPSFKNKTKCRHVIDTNKHLNYVQRLRKSQNLMYHTVGRLQYYTMYSVTWITNPPPLFFS